MGDNVVDVYPALRLVFPGGNAVNVAVAARRAGSETAYIGALGTDTAGRIVRDALVAEGVDISRTRIIEGPNAFSTIDLVGGDRVFGAADLGVSRFELDDSDLDYLGGFDIIHSGDNSMCEDQVPQMAEVAPISYDFGERPPEYWRGLARYVRVACFSAGERSPAEAEDLARAAAGFGPEIVLVTEGARGAMVLEGGKVHRVDTSVTPVDTLGAGDSLIGHFLAGIIAGADANEALAVANVAAAETCGHNGAFGYAHSYGSDAAAEGHAWPLVFDRHGHPDRTAHVPAPSKGASAT
ncbi:MAG: PfkB family carbohydrate kinase [Acidimicrobiales bacterium]